MITSYKKALFDLTVSWSDLVQQVHIPDKLYKYQSFYLNNGEDNPFWKNNIGGEFHLSLAKEFEDINDCRPDISETEIKNLLKKEIINICNFDENYKKNIFDEIDRVVNENFTKKIIDNYQSSIRIGCFTDSFCNQKMWGKYGNNATGFCIEYDTNKSVLFNQFTLPVLYTEKTYNISSSVVGFICNFFADKIINTKIKESKYDKIQKATYIPIFIKNASKWSFEREYRMFLLQHMSIGQDIKKMDDYTDEKHNIDLSGAITAIYLGENFEQNKNSEKLFNVMLELQNQNGYFDIYKIENNDVVKIIK